MKTFTVGFSFTVTGVLAGLRTVTASNEQDAILKYISAIWGKSGKPDVVFISCKEKESE